MRTILIIIFFFPFAIQAKKKHYAYTCDSMSKVFICTEQNPVSVCQSAYSMVSSYKAKGKELFNCNKLNDSTIVATGQMQIKRTGPVKDNIYGDHAIWGSGDGMVSYSLLIQVKPGRIRYEFNNLKHYGCKDEIGALCTGNKSDSEQSTGIKVQFLQRAEEIIGCLKSFSATSSW